MKLCMVGTGYVGLVAGAGFADFGDDVTCVDVDAGRIERLAPRRDPHLRARARRAGRSATSRAGRLAFTTTIADAVAAPTSSSSPSARPAETRRLAPTSRAVDAAARVGRRARDREVVHRHQEHRAGRHHRAGPPHRRRTPRTGPRRLEPRVPQGGRRGQRLPRSPTASSSAACPSDDFARDVMGRLYHPVCLDRDRIVVDGRRSSAELTKYVANAMLAMRISFMNEVAALCEQVGADMHHVRHGVGSDSRIGSKFLYAGPGYGGSCLAPRESVLIRQDGRTRWTTLGALFAALAPKADDTVPEAAAIRPEGLEVFAWSPSARAPCFLPVAAVTRRPYEGELLDVRTKMGRRVRCTPDHPFVAFDAAGAQAKVVPASELTSDHWLPIALGTDTSRRVPATDQIDVLAALERAGVDPAEVIVRYRPHGPRPSRGAGPRRPGRRSRSPGSPAGTGTCPRHSQARQPAPARGARGSGPARRRDLRHRQERHVHPALHPPRRALLPHRRPLPRRGPLHRRRRARPPPSPLLVVPPDAGRRPGRRGLCLLP